LAFTHQPNHSSILWSKHNDAEDSLFSACGGSSVRKHSISSRSTSTPEYWPNDYTDLPFTGEECGDIPNQRWLFSKLKE
jgi:hypothetical protein